MNKIIITKMDGKILTALVCGLKVVQMNLEEEEASPLLGNIYIAKVKHIAGNINAAFLDLGGGRTAYYSLEENKRHLFAQNGPKRKEKEGTEHSLRCGEEKEGTDRSLRCGDEIVVQISRDAAGSKEAMATSSLSFAGRFCVVTRGKRQISFSSKIRDEEWKQQLRGFLLEEEEDGFGVIVRTNAQKAELCEIRNEMRGLTQEYHRILSKAPSRTCYSLLYQAAPAYIGSLRDTYMDFMEEIVTDSREIFEEVKGYLEVHQPEDVGKARLYEDPLLPLSKVYSLEKAMEDALEKRVWLKSGGYLVIEPTEAMTVIDVNSGKYAGKKEMKDTIRRINLEAAREVACQLRLRNLSGIILVDFIDMSDQADRDELMETLAGCCKKDPVKTTVVDMTKLGLVELTRKKIRKPLREQLGKGERKR